MLHTLMLLAQDAPVAPKGPPEGGNPLSMFIMMGLIMMLGYFLLLRPAQRQEKERKALISALKKNDKVVNAGGIIGIVDAIKEKEDEVILKGGLHITKSSIVRILNPDEAPKES